MKKSNLFAIILLAVSFVFTFVGCTLNPEPEVGRSDVVEEEVGGSDNEGASGGTGDVGGGKYEELGFSPENEKAEVEKEAADDFINKLIESGFEEDVDYTVEYAGDKVIFVLTEEGKEKLDNQIKAESGEIEGETISVDLTEKKWLVNFRYNLPTESCTREFSIGKQNGLKIGDKLNVKVKLEVSKDISLLTAGIFYYGEGGKYVFLGNQDNDAEVKKDIKANEEFEASFTYNVTKVDVPADKELFIEFKYSNADPYERTYIGSNRSAEDTHFKVSSTADGLKIETKEVIGETRKKGSGAYICFYVNGKRLPISIGIDDEHKGAETFIYPFVSKDDVVYAEYYEVYETASKEYISYEFVRVKSEFECENIEDYVDLDKLNSITPKVKYDADENNFFFGFDTTVSSAKEIFIGSANDYYRVGYTLLSGEKDWSDTGWLVNQAGVSVDENGEFVIFEGYFDYENSEWVNEEKEFFTEGKNLNLPFASWKPVNEILESIATHGNKYWGQLNFDININGTWYPLSTLFTDTYIFGENDLSNVDIDVEDTLSKAVAEVKNVPATEAEFKEMLDDVIAEYEGFFESMDSSNARAVVTTGKEVLKAAEIAEQINNFVKGMVTTINDVISKGSNNELNKILIDFDKQINVGQVSFVTWFDAICDIYAEIGKMVIPMPDDGLTTQRSLTTLICESMGISSGDFYKYLNLLDKYATIEKFYLDLDVEADGKYLGSETTMDSMFAAISSHEDEDLASVELGTILSLGIINIDDAIKTIIKDITNKNIAVVLPVKALQLKIDASVDAKATYGNLVSIMQIIAEGPSETTTYPVLDAELNYGCKVAVCTKDKVGGIVSLDISYSLENEKVKEYVEQVFEMMQEASNPSFDATEMAATLATLYDSIYSVTISVSDGFSKTYKYSEFMELMGNYIPVEQIM